MPTISFYRKTIDDAELKERIDSTPDATILYVFDCKLTKFPDIRTLIKLRRITLSENYIDDIPSYIFDFPDLEYLEIINNRIRHIPNNIGNAKKLGYINLGQNMISQIPQTIKNCPCLHTIYLDFNNISDIRPLTNESLRYICLDNNDIEEIPIAIFKIGLKELYLSRNKITSIPREIINSSINIFKAF